MSELIPFNGRGRAVDMHTGVAAVEGPAGGDHEAGLEVGQILAVLRRYLWLIVATSAVAVVGAFLLTSRQKVLFKATAVVRIADQRRSLTTGISDAAAGSDFLVDPMTSTLQLLQSRGVAEEIVRRTPVRLSVEDPTFSLASLSAVAVADSAPLDSIHVSFGPASYSAHTRATTVQAPYGRPVQLPGVTFTVDQKPAVAQATIGVRPFNQAVSEVRTGFQSLPRERTDVVDISYSSPDPYLAQQVVNTGVQVFVESDAKSSKEQSALRRTFIASQLQSADSSVRETQKELSDFQRRNNVLSAREKFAAAQTSLMQLQQRIEELRADRNSYASMLDKLPKSPTLDRAGIEAVVASGSIASSPLVMSLYTDLDKLESEKEGLVAGAWGKSPNNPDAERLDQLIASTQKKLVQALQNQLAATDARIGVMEDLYKRQTTEMDVLPQSESEETLIGQRLEADQKIADLLREEYQKARIAEAAQLGNVSILDLAPMPAPIGRGRAQKIVLALMLGIFVGVGLALVMDRMNTAVRTRDEVEQMLQAPGLAVIPQINARSGLASRFLPRLGSGRAAVAKATAEGLASSQVRTAAAEAFRTLRTNILFSEASGRIRRMVVTSAAPSEGKTTVTVNLAAAFATQGMRVLIIDCDMRRPRMHQLFGVPREPGITHVLLGKATMQDAIRPTNIPRLWVLPVGTLPPSPSEFLGSERMKQALDQLSNDYDLVVIDSPPLIAASDAAILGSNSDGVLVVIRAGRTDRALVRQARQQLAAVHARILGAVLNDADDQLTRYDSYYEYYYEYYGSYADSEPRPA